MRDAECSLLLLLLSRQCGLLLLLSEDGCLLLLCKRSLLLRRVCIASSWLLEC